MELFARSGPWTGTIGERMDKFEKVHQDLCRIYGKQTRLRFGLLDGSCSGSSYYHPSSDVITLQGKLSVVTYVHEFAHALGKIEHGACRWSVNLFWKCFPEQFGYCQSEGHMLRRRRQ